MRNGIAGSVTIMKYETKTCCLGETPKAAQRTNPTTMTIEERKEKARETWPDGFAATRSHPELFVFTESELNALLREVAAQGFHEGNMHTRVKANQAGCTKEVDDAMYKAGMDSEKWLDKKYPLPEGIKNED